MTGGLLIVVFAILYALGKVSFMALVIASLIDISPFIIIMIIAYICEKSDRRRW